MSGGASVGDVIGAIFVLAVVFILVRPSSLAPDFIKAVGDALDGIVRFAVSG